MYNRGVLTDTTSHVAVLEQGPRNWSAYVPDLPGCVAAARTREETERLIQEAIEFTWKVCCWMECRSWNRLARRNALLPLFSFLITFADDHLKMLGKATV